MPLGKCRGCKWPNVGKYTSRLVTLPDRYYRDEVRTMPTKEDRKRIVNSSTDRGYRDPAPALHSSSVTKLLLLLVVVDGVVAKDCSVNIGDLIV